jgi:peptide/nickel transport system substrate-binding protein
MTLLTTILSYISAFFIALLPFPSYTEGVVGYPQSFLPTEATSRNEKTISDLIYRSLFKYDIYGSLEPDLAETWSLSDGGLVYTITLKDNQYWSNGKKITADDLIYTAFNTEDLKGVATDKVDERTVRYTLPNKYAPFLNLLTISVMPNNANKSNPLKPVVSDDFRIGWLEKSGTKIKKVVLVTDNKSNTIKKIVFRYYSNEGELVTAAKLGEIDGFMAEEVHEDLENMDNYRFPLQGIYYALFFNLRNETYEALEIRQKLEKVLPIKQAIVNDGISVQGAISRSLFTDTGVDYDKYDPTFEENMGHLKVTVTVPDVKKHVRMARVIKDIWEDKLGLDVVIRKVDSEDFLSKVIEPRDFEILLFGQEISRDPDRYVVWHSTQTNHPGLNVSGFSHVRADRALEEGRSELDNEERTIHYNEFQRVIHEQIPVIFLYHPYQNFYVSDYIQGIGEKYTFTPGDRFLDFYNWARVKTN